MGTQSRGLLNGFLHNKETQVVAVCDVDTTRREHAKKTVEDYYAKQTDKGTFKGCAAYKDFRELLARKDIDAVVIATPDHWHALIAIAAANAGKDIYCEKPLSLTIREARAMVKAVRRKTTGFSRPAACSGRPRNFARRANWCATGASARSRQVIVGRGRARASAVRSAGGADGARPGLGLLARAGADAALQLRAQPARRAYALPELAQLPRILRRHDDRLGRASLRHRPMGPGHGRQRAGGNHPARGPEGHDAACATSTPTASR